MSTCAPLSLRDCQQLLQRESLRGNSGIARHVQQRPPADSARRVQVYADAYRLRLMEVLGNDYPTLKNLIGGDLFAERVSDYIDAHPSNTPSVRYFGRHLPAWLRQTAGIAPEIASSWAELAHFEWAQGEVFDAADADVALLADVAGIAPQDWPALPLRLRPATRLLSLHGNAPALALAQSRDEALPEPVMQSQATRWLVWRLGYDVHWRALEADEAAALDAVAGGTRFGELCEVLAESTPVDEVALRAASLLKRWLNDELIARFET